MRSKKKGSNLDELVKLYKASVGVKDKTFASTLVAEALASESAAIQNSAAESTSIITARAISKLAK